MSRLLDTYPTRHNSRGAANYGVVEADAVGRRSSAPGKQRPGRSGFNHDRSFLTLLLAAPRENIARLWDCFISRRRDDRLPLSSLLAHISLSIQLRILEFLDTLFLKTK